MSLILDALNRSRVDNQEVPDIAARHYPDSAEPEPWSAGRWRTRLPWLALLAALLVIAALLLERASRSPAAPPTAIGSDTVSAPATHVTASSELPLPAPVAVAPPAPAVPADPLRTAPAAPLPAAADEPAAAEP